MKIELAKTETIHFVGIGGIGMSGLALIMKRMGFNVQGSDVLINKNIDCELFDFNEDISNLMSKSNICITRAGASTLAELVFLNLPFMAIPLPTSKDNHQFENALFYENIGCNWILNQNEINDETVANKLFNIIDNKDELLFKKINMKNFSYQNTWNNINQEIISVINENRISKN